MKVGDLVDDGFGCFGVIVALGWIFPESVNGKIAAYQVHFPKDPALNGWYEYNDLKLISQNVEEL